jgi:hypothetical protein
VTSATARPGPGRPEHPQWIDRNRLGSGLEHVRRRIGDQLDLGLVEESEAVTWAPLWVAPSGG